MRIRLGIWRGLKLRNHGSLAQVDVKWPKDSGFVNHRVVMSEVCACFSNSAFYAVEISSVDMCGGLRLLQSFKFGS